MAKKMQASTPMNRAKTSSYTGSRGKNTPIQIQAKPGGEGGTVKGGSFAGVHVHAKSAPHAGAVRGHTGTGSNAPGCGM